MLVIIGMAGTCFFILRKSRKMAVVLVWRFYQFIIITKLFEILIGMTNRIVREGENKARAIVEAAERQSSEKWDCFEKRARELIAAHTELQRLIKRGG